ncbi:MAG: CPBP family intramembrane glutamic endopeptidase [Luteibacter sp.]
MPPNDRRRAAIAFALLFVLYQGVEGIGARLLGSIPVQAAFTVSVVLVAWPLGRWLGFRGYDAYALEWRRAAPVFLSGGLALALLTKYLAVCVGMALNVYAARAPQVPSVAAVSFLSSIPWALGATFVPAVAGDILARGFVYRAVRIAWAPWMFVLVSTLVYALCHVYMLGRGPVEWLRLLCFGLAYATAVARTGSLWLAIGLHWGWNLAFVLVGDILPYETLAPGWSALLSAGAHLVMLGVLFAIPAPLERDELNADPA